MTTDIFIRAEFNLPDVIGPEKFTPHIASAATDVKRLIGEDLYATIAGEASTRHDDCTKAMTYLAMAYAVFSLNIETSGNGIVTSKGFDSSRSELMSFQQIERMATHYRQTGMKFLQPHIPADAAATNEDGTEDPGTLTLGKSYLSVV